MSEGPDDDLFQRAACAVASLGVLDSRRELTRIADEVIRGLAIPGTDVTAPAEVLAWMDRLMGWSLPEGLGERLQAAYEGARADPLFGAAHWHLAIATEALLFRLRRPPSITRLFPNLDHHSSGLRAHVALQIALAGPTDAYLQDAPLRLVNNLKWAHGDAIGSLLAGLRGCPDYAVYRGPLLRAIAECRPRSDADGKAIAQLFLGHRIPNPLGERLRRSLRAAVRVIEGFPSFDVNESLGIVEGQIPLPGEVWRRRKARERDVLEALRGEPLLAPVVGLVDLGYAPSGGAALG